MIKTEEMEDTILRHKVVSVLCNRCGSEMITEYCLKGNGVNVVFEGGFDSNEFGDCTRVEFDLCESCLAQLVEDFKIKPKIEVSGWWDHEG